MGLSSKLVLSGMLVPLVYLVKVVRDNGDFLNGSSSDRVIPDWGLQLGLFGFCLSESLLGKIEQTVEVGESTAVKGANYSYNFETTGGINEGEYDKGSIYSYLYSAYKNVGTVSGKDVGVDDFEFTQNTWGIANEQTKPGNRRPQRHGEQSYGHINTNSKDVQNWVEERIKGSGELRVVEIGCGTGAGASYLTKHVLPEEGTKYMAIDMQRGGIDTCNRLHASKNLDCVHIPSGVGNGPDGKVPLADGQADIVIILETHIAELQIGPEEKAIFAEIKRVLKPGGFFLWGNALPTDVWFDSEAYLPTVGFSMVQSWNNTIAAVKARDEDAPRVGNFMTALRQHHHAFQVLPTGRADRCWSVVDKLVRNFFRDPDTSLYLKMVVNIDSYMHYAWRRGN